MGKRTDPRNLTVSLSLKPMHEDERGTRRRRKSIVIGAQAQEQEQWDKPDTNAKEGCDV